VTEDFDFEAEPEEALQKPKVTRRRSTGPRGPSKRVTNLESALTKQMFQAGAVIGLALPVTGLYICTESAVFCESVTRLAAKDPRYLEALEQLATIGPGIAIGRTVVGVACAVGADRYHRTDGEHGINPDKRVAMLLGVSQAYYELYGDEERENGDSGSGVYVPPPAGRFAPIG